MLAAIVFSLKLSLICNHKMEPCHCRRLSQICDSLFPSAYQPITVNSNLFSRLIASSMCVNFEVLCHICKCQNILQSFCVLIKYCLHFTYRVIVAAQGSGRSRARCK